MSFDAYFEKIEDFNPSFKVCSLRVHALGGNRNGSFISESSFLKSKDTIYNIPLVSMFNPEKVDVYGGEGDLEDHNVELKENSSGDYELVMNTIPIGVVPSDCELTYESIEEDGDTKTYIRLSKVFLWKRYEAVRKISQWLAEGVNPQVSMEIEIDSGFFNSETGLFHIEKFIYEAICVLGSDVEACFPKAELLEYNKNIFENQFFEMVKELKESIGDYQSNNMLNFDSITIDNSKKASTNSPSWGDVNKTKLRNDIMEADNYKALTREAYLIRESEWEDSPSQKLKYPHHVIRGGKLVVHEGGLKAARQRLEQTKPEGIETARNHLKKHYKELEMDFTLEEGGFNVSEKFELTSQQLTEELSIVLREFEAKEDDWGYKISRYFYIDHSVEKMKVYAFDRKDNWRLVGFDFSVEKDNVKVDFESKLRYKISYEPMEVDEEPETEFVLVHKEVVEYEKDVVKKETEKELTEKFTSEKENAVKEVQKEVDTKQQEIEEMQNKYSVLEKEVKDLKQFKDNKIIEERKQAEEELFTKFSTQLNEEEIAPIKEKAEEMSLDEIQTALVIEVGKKNLKFSIEKPKKNLTVLPVPKNKNDREEKPYGDDLDKYAEESS